MAGVEPPNGAAPTPGERAGRPGGAGLCDSCIHQQVVRTTRGSAFSLCRRSRTEPERFVRYPRLPVLRCEGWEEEK